MAQITLFPDHRWLVLKSYCHLYVITTKISCKHGSLYVIGGSFVQHRNYDFLHCSIRDQDMRLVRKHPPFTSVANPRNICAPD